MRLAYEMMSKIRKYVFSNLNANGRFCRDIERDIVLMRDFKEKNPDKKVVIVLYSGGLDSSYLLLKNLDKGNYVVPVTNLLNCNDIGNATIIEHYLIHKNMEHLENKFSCDRLNRLVCSTESQVLNNSSFVYYQQIYNVMSIFSLGYDYLKYVDEVQMGLILGDDGVSYISELRSLFNTSLKMVYIEDDDEPLKLKLAFPLIKKPKDKIAADFVNLKQKLGVDIKTLSCEEPIIKVEKKDKNVNLIIKPCQCCNSCKKNRSLGLRNLDIVMTSRIFKK